ncbi:MAG: ion channel [Chitinophagales bacterium]
MIKQETPQSLRHDDSTGLSAKVQSRNRHSFKPNGSFNVIVEGLPWLKPYEMYHGLITMSWWKFNLTVLITFLTVNSFFAAIYFLIGVNELTAYSGTSEWEAFQHCFFFSAQSLTTVGYGRIAPVGPATSWVASFEAMTGLLIFALATGLLYGKFSRPSARIIHSNNALVSPYQSETAFMFRIANKRTSQLVDADVQVTLNKIDVVNGEERRMFYPLKLERHRINMLPLTWTVVHPINEESPLYDKTMEDWEKEDIEILVYFKAFDETFANHVHSRISYKRENLVWGAKFILNFKESQDGATIHYVNMIDDYETVELPGYRAAAGA